MRPGEMATDSRKSKFHKNQFSKKKCDFDQYFTVSVIIYISDLCCRGRLPMAATRKIENMKKQLPIMNLSNILKIFSNGTKIKSPGTRK